MEIHVELACKTKMFSRALSPAGIPEPGGVDLEEAGPNTLIDPVVLALPGALPVLNKRAIEMSVLVGMALNCEIAEVTKWDRKGYFYPDLPKSYQISQYDLPVSGKGWFDLPGVDEAGFVDFSKPVKRIRIIRAHLEEDAGKLLHELPGGGRSEETLADYNRAGTALLEIVTEPDFTSSEEAMLFAKLLRQVCRGLRVTRGVMQLGHMRFEPNINCTLHMADGGKVVTPIVEIKNLNSFKALKGAIEFELRDQPRRWMEDGREMGRGMKITRGWDDEKMVTFVQREKEDAHDYRYFPDPDLLPVRIDAAWKAQIAAGLPPLPLERLREYTQVFGLAIKEATQLVEEPETTDVYEKVIDGVEAMGVARARAGKIAANLLLQTVAKRANERGVRIDEACPRPMLAAGIVVMKEAGQLGNQGVEELFDVLIGSAEGMDAASALALAREEATKRGLMIVEDAGALKGWVETVLAANPKAVEDIRAGKVQAAGRLVGEVMKLAGGRADAKKVRDAILAACAG